MSFRHTFVTDYIYQASDETKDVTKIFEDWCGSTLKSVVDERGYGFYSGMFNGLYPIEYENDLKEVIPKLEKATKVPFRLTILAESGPAITYQIEPNPQ